MNSYTVSKCAGVRCSFIIISGDQLTGWCRTVKNSSGRSGNSRAPQKRTKTVDGLAWITQPSWTAVRSVLAM